MSALKNITIAMAQNISWMEWKPSSGIVTAYAIDPTSEERTGKLRSVNGSLVPASAEPAKSDTPRDHFCVNLVDRLLKGDIGKKSVSPEKQAMRDAVKKAREDAQAAKAEAKAAKKAERAQAAEAAKTAKAERKAAQAETKAKKAETEEVKETVGPTGAFTLKDIHLESTPGTSLAEGHPPLKVGSYLVLKDGQQVGIVMPGKLIETEDAADPKIVLTEKSWAVYQGKDRKAFGVIKAS